MKIIINHDGAITGAPAVYYVMKVIEEGLISKDGTAYCYATTFKNGVCVTAKRTKSGHSFFVTNK